MAGERYAVGHKREGVRMGSTSIVPGIVQSLIHPRDSPLQ